MNTDEFDKKGLAYLTVVGEGAGGRIYFLEKPKCRCRGVDTVTTLLLNFLALKSYGISGMNCRETVVNAAEPWYRPMVRLYRSTGLPTR
jgi:hypothetical protein